MTTRPSTTSQTAAAQRTKVREALVERIQRLHAPGTPLGSEASLVKELRVSRQAVRDTLADLHAAGLLERPGGKGPFLTVPHGASRLHLHSFRRAVQLDAGPTANVVSATSSPASLAQAEAFALLPTEEVVRIERLHSDAGVVVAREIAEYPGALYPGLLARHGGEDVRPADFGLEPTAQTRTLRAEVADKQLRALFGYERKAAVLVREVRIVAGDRLIGAVTTWFRGEQYEVRGDAADPVRQDAPDEGGVALG